jgi:hypothetical protein
MQIVANGIGIELDDQGPAGAEPLLLIMGLGMQLIGWPDELVQLLVSRGFRVIRHDNRDVGLSQGFDHLGVPNLPVAAMRHALRLQVHAPYSIGDMADDALGVIENAAVAVNDGRIAWVGKLAALPQSFQILDMQDSQSAIKRIIKAMNLDEERFVPKQVSWFIAGSKEDGLRPGDVDIRDAHTQKLVDIFRAEPGASLLGTAALRDGVDVPGESLRQVIMEGVPWSRRTVLHSARRLAGGGNVFDDRVTMDRLAQAFGRLIRRADDRGHFVLLGAAVPSRLLGAFPAGVPIDRVTLDQAVALVKAGINASGQPSGDMPDHDRSTSPGAP